MGIFQQMHEGRHCESEREYRELLRMLNEAITRGYIEDLRPFKSGGIAATEKWFRDKETGEIYSLGGDPIETRGGWWAKIDPDDFLESDQPTH